MHSFRKFLTSILLLAMFVYLFSFIIIQFHFKFGLADSDVRKELAGTINVFISGASHSSCAFVPEILDKSLDCNSYVLADNGLTLEGRYELLQKELARNPVKLVVIDASSDLLTRDRRAEGPKNDIRAISLFETASERRLFMKHTLQPLDYLEAYPYLLYEGLGTLGHKLLDSTSEFDKKLGSKGYQLHPNNDVSLSFEDLKNQYHSYQDPARVQDENVSLLLKTIELCVQNNVDVIFVVVPISEASSTRDKNLDEKFQLIREISSEYHIMYLDFNLLKKKTELFPDSTSFYNLSHMSDVGAKEFSQVFSQIMLKIKSGESIEKYFYDSYQQKENSIYSQFSTMNDGCS